MRLISNGIIHTHSCDSLKDSTLRVEDLVKTASDLGAPAVTLTDHGFMTGIPHFMKVIENHNKAVKSGEIKGTEIKGIPGVEAYFEENNSIGRSHMLLLAKNYKGYIQIAKAITAANERVKNDECGKDFPAVNWEILERIFSKGTDGHNNVIATSGCVGGILARILLGNDSVNRKISALEEKLKKYDDPNDPAIVANKQKVVDLESQLKALVEKRDELKKLSSKSFEGKIKKVENAFSNNNPDANELKAALDAEMHEAEKAKDELEEIKTKIASIRKSITAINKRITEADKSANVFMDIKKDIQNEQALLKNDAELETETIKTANRLKEIFGEGNFFIELQYHGIEDEAIVMPKLAEIAKKLNIPVVACNDVHYATNSPKEIKARQLVRSLRFNKWEDLRAGDTEYYIKTDNQLKSALNNILDSEIIENAFKGISDIVSMCDVKMDYSSHYPKWVSEDGESASQRLKRLAIEGAKRCFNKKSWTPEYAQRLKYELRVIETLGFSDYLCIVQDFISYARNLVEEYPEKVGLTVGPGRGSAVGSLVCYLIGITNKDPIKYGLLFERFLNPDRVTMPDIDTDFHTELRAKVIDYVKEKYGKNAVSCIMTKGTLAARSSVRGAARVISDREYGETRELLNLADSIAKTIPFAPNASVVDCLNEINSKFASEEHANEIVESAILIEKTPIQYGMHAAGVIIADNGDVGEYVPLMYNRDRLDESKSQWMCQCLMGEAEELGLLKMDFLGLKTLNIISDTLRAIKRNYGLTLDIEKISDIIADGKSSKYDVNGNVFKEIFSKGRTNSVFQFESSGMKTMLKDFKPGNIEDLILLVACYRPGPLQYLDDIIAVKKGKKKPKYIVPEMEAILKDTYGYTVYQEQVMEICNKIAGFSLGEADIIRRAMGKKKIAILTDPKTNYKGRIVDAFIKKGASKKDAEDFWEQLLEFSNYAFNKSHACAYAFVSLYTAWLKLNYPAEYMAAVLNNEHDIQKYPMLIAECKNMGVEVNPPDINKSEVDFKAKDGILNFGLGCVKAVKNSADEIVEQRGKKSYSSFSDYIRRGHKNKAVTEALIESGAFDCWCSNRAAMLNIFPQLAEDAKKIDEKNEKIKELVQLKESTEEELKNATTSTEKTSCEKNLKSIERRIENAKNALEQYKTRFNSTLIPTEIRESKLAKLNKEKERIGMYVSGHPLDDYDDAKEKRTDSISDCIAGNATLTGIISDVRFHNRKTDNKPMAFFKLEDETGEIEVCCFTEAYAKCGLEIVAGNAVAITGLVRTEDSIYEDSEDEQNKKMFVKTITELQKNIDQIVVSVNDIADWKYRVAEIIDSFKGRDHKILLYDKMTGELRKTDICVSADIWYSNIKNVEINKYQ